MFAKALQIISKKNFTNVKLLKTTTKIRFQSFCDNNSADNSIKPFKSDQLSLLNIKRTIKAYSSELEDGYTCIRTVCPVCDRQKPMVERKQMYINKATGAIICPSCQLVDKWNNMEKFFTETKSVRAASEIARKCERFVSSKLPIQLPQIQIDSLKSGTDLSPNDLQSILEHLSISEQFTQPLINLEILCDQRLKIIYIPLRDVDNRIVGYKKLSRLKSVFTEDTLPTVNCFGIVSTKTSKLSPKESTTAVIVLSILDLLALSLQKINSTIICVPYGFKSMPLECLPSLERYNKLILWFENDTPGWDTAHNFARKFNEKRCTFVRPTDQHPTPYIAWERQLDIKLIINSAQPILHKAITTFSALRQDVLSDLQNIDKVQGVKWHRFPTLNKLLKGHRKGELTVLTGPTGCGKTTFMSEYSLDLSLQGVNTLWGSFEIRNARLASTLLRQLAGYPLDENIHEFDRWAGEFEQLPLYFMTFHGQQSIKVVMETIEHAQYVHDIHHVIIDNVQFMMGITDEAKHIDRFWKQDAIISSFRTFATKKNCHVTLVIHPRKERDQEDLTTNSIFGSAKATQEADNVLIIQDKRLTSIRGKKYLQVAKNRYSGDLGIMPLDFDKAGLSYAIKKKKPEDKVITELS